MDLLWIFVDTQTKLDCSIIACFSVSSVITSLLQICNVMKPMMLDLGAYFLQKQFASLPFKSDIYNIDLIRLLVDRENEVDPKLFSLACQNNYLSQERYLLQLGTRVNTLAQSGRLPITATIITSNTELFDLLVSHGAIPPTKQRLMDKEKQSRN